MASETVRVLARATAREGKAEELKAVLLAIVEPTRAEAGCVRYELCQSRTDPCDFVFIEEWASPSALDAHMASPHVQEVFRSAPPLLAKPPEIVQYAKLA
jgi:quinol monooxygenase YgiN